MQHRLFLTAFLSLFLSLSFAQQSLRDAVKQSKVNGYFRSYFMQTINEDSLQDWHSLAVGGKLGFETGTFHGFSVGAAFYASINTGVGNVTDIDSTTGRASRYVLGNYDIQNPSDREIYQLGEAYIRYKNKGHEVQLGRMHRLTPLLNHQDGRMIPSLFQGVWYTNSSLKKWRFELAGLNAVLPRSTNKWYSIESSLVYPQGLSTEGGRSNYTGNIDSDFIGIGRVSGQFTKKIKINIWNFYTDNVFNTLYSELVFQDSLKSWQFTAGGQQIHQTRVNNGGNADITKSYFQDRFSNVYGGKVGLAKNGWQFWANLTHVSDEGRFVYPREWGREFLYTFQKRERQEGSRNLTTWMISAGKKHQLKNKDVLRATLGYGHYNRPEATDNVRNKFAMPANSQMNLDVFYHFNWSFPGLTLEALIVYKGALGDTYDNPNFVLNKVNMWNYQLILNYRF